MVGMAGFFSAAAHVPISTVIMVSEMTGNYHLLVPTMFVCMLGFLLVRRHTIYEKQLPSRSASPTQQRQIIRTLLEHTKGRGHSGPAAARTSSFSERTNAFACRA
jgi:CIC family chloride channel protein